MSEQQTAVWTMSSVISAEYNIVMKEFTDLSYVTSEQHKDMTEARMKRDHDELEKVSTKLLQCSPFSSDPSLRNVVNGVVAVQDVNVHEYDSVADKIIQKMIGQPVFTFSFSRKDKAKTLGETSAVRVAPDRTLIPCFCFNVSC